MSNDALRGLCTRAGKTLAICTLIWGGTDVAPAQCPTEWQAMLPFVGGNSPDDAVFALIEHDGMLVAGGEFTNLGEDIASHVATWDGITWRALGIGQDDLLNPPLRAMQSYQGALYAGGRGRVLRWDGTSWQDAFPEFPMDGFATSMVVYGGELILSRAVNFGFDVRGGRLVAWNGAEARSLLQQGVNGFVNALLVFDGELLAAGGFTLIDGIVANRIARWNGESWSSFGTGPGNGLGSSVNAMTTFQGELCVGGLFITAGGLPANRVARWTGTAWQRLEPGGGGSEPSGLNGEVRALLEYRGDLIVGGGFSTAGPVSARNIARWTGSQWLAMAGGTNPGLSNVVCAVTDFDQKLVAGGFFAAAGTLVAPRVAQWGAVCPLGDMNCDGLVNCSDIDPFIVAVKSRSAYEDKFPDCRFDNADMNGDGTVTVSDVGIFARRFLAGCP